MSLKVFPDLPGLTWPVLRTAEFHTEVQSAKNKYEVRLPQMVNPLWHWQLIYDFLRDFPYGSFTVSELNTLLDFFLYQGGQAGEFLFTDPDSNYVGPALVNGVPNAPMAQLQVVNDGAGNYYSPVQRTMGGSFFEDVPDLNGGIAVYANGILMKQGSPFPYSADYQLFGPGLAVPGAAYVGMYIQWWPYPAPGAPSLTKVAGGSLAPATYFVRSSLTSTQGESLPGAEASIAIGVGTAPAAVLSQVAGGTRAARTEYARVTYVNSLGETLGSPEASLAVAANSLLSVASPGAAGDATGWNVYVSTATGTETKQNAAPVAIGTNWTEPTTGLIAGAALPVATTALGLLRVDAPAPPYRSAQTGWNVYVSTATGVETRQNAVPISYAAPWVEPNTGLIAGAALPIVDTSANPAAPVTAEFSYYFRVRFESDERDMEKFAHGFWTIGGSEARSGSGMLKLVQVRPNPL